MSTPGLAPSLNKFQCVVHLPSRTGLESTELGFRSLSDLYWESLVDHIDQGSMSHRKRVKYRLL